MNGSGHRPYDFSLTTLFFSRDANVQHYPKSLCFRQLLKAYIRWASWELGRTWAGLIPQDAGFGPERLEAPRREQEGRHDGAFGLL